MTDEKFCADIEHKTGEHTATEPRLRQVSV